MEIDISSEEQAEFEQAAINEAFKPVVTAAAEGIEKGTPQNEYPQKEYSQREYPQKEYPQREYPQKEYPQKVYPQNLTKLQARRKRRRENQRIRSAIAESLNISPKLADDTPSSNSAHQSVKNTVKDTGRIPTQAEIDKMTDKEHGDLIHRFPDVFFFRGIYLDHLWPVAKDEFDVPKYVCFNCGKPGHQRRDCREPEIICCHNCGRRDVTVNSCPRCWRANLRRHPDRIKNGNAESRLPVKPFTSSPLKDIKPVETNQMNRRNVALSDPFRGDYSLSSGFSSTLPASFAPKQARSEIQKQVSPQTWPTQNNHQASNDRLEKIAKLAAATRGICPTVRRLAMVMAQESDVHLQQLLDIATDQDFDLSLVEATLRHAVL